MNIIFQLISFQLILIQAYALFYLVFHKGGENSYFIFQLVFGLPLIFTPILYDEKWLKENLIWILIWYHMLKMKIFTIGIKILFTFNWYYWFISFKLVSLITRIPLLIYFLIGIMLEEYVLLFSWTPLLMIDKKGEKNLSLYACFYDYACFYIGIQYWYQECLFLNIVWLVWFFIGIKSII